MEIIGFTFMGSDPEGKGYPFDVPFVGVAARPGIKEAPVEGVDLLLIDWEGIGHLDLYFTDTDKQGEKISALSAGLAIIQTPDRILF